MGGYGSLINGMKYHDTFGKIMAFSSALHMDEMAKKGEDYEHKELNGAFIREVFGEPGEMKESEKNPRYLLARLKKEGADLPELYMACGTEDYLIEKNRNFLAFLREQQIPVHYHEQPGIHDWEYWNKELQLAVPWLMK